MNNPDDSNRQIQELIARLQELNARLIEDNKWLKNRLDIGVNSLALQAEEIQRLKDEIAILKGQKPRPKIPPSTLEGSKSTGKKNDKDGDPRGKHPRRKKTNQLKIHTRTRIRPDTIPEGAVFKGCQKFTVKTSFSIPTTPCMNLNDGGCLMGPI